MTLGLTKSRFLAVRHSTLSSTMSWQRPTTAWFNHPIGFNCPQPFGWGPILRKNLQAFVISPISLYSLQCPFVDTADRGRWQQLLQDAS